jgi:hypothetical protein
MSVHEFVTHAIGATALSTVRRYPHQHHPHNRRQHAGARWGMSAGASVSIAAGGLIAAWLARRLAPRTVWYRTGSSLTRQPDKARC